MQKRLNAPRHMLSSPLLLAGVAACVFAAYTPSAQALGLGPAVVKSALGQPLRAEIDITDLTPGEADALTVRIPGPDAFRASGIDYSRIAADVAVSVQKRANGRTYLQLRSNQTVTDPFLDIIVEATTASGRILRDYTLLFDPPNPNAPVRVAADEPAPITPASRAAPAPRAPATRVARAPAAPKPESAAEKPAAKPSKPLSVPAVATGADSYTVKSGDTLTKIAEQVKTSSVSLDQMLAALFVSNQSAFVHGNINKIAAGTVLKLPTEASASNIARDEARRIVVAQSRDFGAYRQALAKAVAEKPAAVAEGSQQAGAGKVESKVQDRNAPAAQPDKLTLSKGQMQGKGAPSAEAKVAQSRAAKESSERLAELNRNVSE
ncbi:MAG: LysM peptidoglycan-binding domain-containing protein, partial [Betaproteobacteria bacterium]|nr:LysM peptidoglycan-binding domain-containing protein [Betaproteobacteria bacterium]